MLVELKDGRSVKVIGVDADNQQFFTLEKEKIDFEDVLKVVEDLPFYARLFKKLWESLANLFKAKNTNF